MKSWLNSHFHYFSSAYAILLLGVMPLLVSPWRTEVFYDIKLVFTVVITLILSILHVLGGRSCHFGGIGRIMPIYAALVTGATLFSIDPALSLYGLAICREGGASLLLYLLVFLIFSNSHSWSERSMNIVLHISAAVSIFGMLQYFSVLPEIRPFVGEGEYGTMATLGNRNFAGAYCTLLLPPSLWLFLKKGRPINLFHSAALLGMLFCSMTRSAWLAFAVYFILLMLFILDDKAAVIRGLSLAAVVLAVFSFFNLVSDSALADRAFTIISDAANIFDDSSGSGRVYIWKWLLTDLESRPFLGYGPDTFGLVYGMHDDPSSLQFPKAHNEYLQIALTTGIPSLLVYLLLVVLVLTRSLKRIKSEVWVGAIFCSVIGYLVQAFFNISVITTAPVYWAFLGMLAGKSDEKYRDIEKSYEILKV